jgi:hypothetical protein
LFVRQFSLGLVAYSGNRPSGWRSTGGIAGPNSRCFLKPVCNDK